MPETSLRGFQDFCAGLTVAEGRPFVLEPFQRKALRDFYAGVVETFIIVPKKNGKSTLLAALALYHLTHTENAMIPILAAAQDQAMWMFDQARGFVQRSPELQAQVRVLRGMGDQAQGSAGRQPEGDTGDDESSLPMWTTSTASSRHCRSSTNSTGTRSPTATASCGTGSCRGRR